MVDMQGELSASAKEKLTWLATVAAIGGCAVVGSVSYALATSKSSVEVYQEQYTDSHRCLEGTDFDVRHASPITRFVNGNEILTIVPDETQTRNPSMLNFVVDHEGIFKTKAILHPSDQATDTFLADHC